MRAGELATLAGDVDEGNKGVGLAASKAGLQAEDRRAALDAGQALGHVFDQQLHVFGRVRAGEEAGRVAVVGVGVGAAGENVPQVRGEDGVGQFALEDFAPGLAAVEDGGQGRHDDSLDPAGRPARGNAVGRPQPGRSSPRGEVLTRPGIQQRRRRRITSRERVWYADEEVAASARRGRKCDTRQLRPKGNTIQPKRQFSLG